MTIPEFKIEIEKLFPVKRESEDFRDDLRKVLRNYKKLICSLDEEIKTEESSWDEQNIRLDKLITGINNCVSNYYKRAHSTAYITLFNQMMGTATIKGLFESIELYSIKRESIYGEGVYLRKTEEKPMSICFIYRSRNEDS